MVKLIRFVLEGARHVVTSVYECEQVEELDLTNVFKTTSHRFELR